MLESITAFDIAVLATVLLSMLFAFGRGFVTVALSFVAWAGAFFASTAGFTYIQPYGRDLIEPKELADIITLIALFFVTLLVLKMLADLIGRTVKESPIGFLDRSLGAAFGLARGVVIVSVAYLAFSKLYPGNQAPDWVDDAQLKPIVAWSAEMVEEFARDALGTEQGRDSQAYLKKVQNATESQFSTEKLKEFVPEYSKPEQQQLDNLFEQLEEETSSDDKGGK